MENVGVSVATGAFHLKLEPSDIYRWRLSALGAVGMFVLGLPADLSRNLY